MYIDVKETKKYFLVRMKKACEDALSSEPILSQKKKSLRKVACYKLRPVGAARLSYPTFFLLMILMQNFILINNHIKPQAYKSPETTLLTFKVR